MKIHVTCRDNVVTNVSTTPLGGSMEVEIDDKEVDAIFTTPHIFYCDGETVVRNEELVVEAAKVIQRDFLDAACNAAILSGFDHTIDGVTYHFSFDMEAQFNFQGVLPLFDKGIIDSIMWTVKLDGEHVRIPITKKIMDELSLVILRHKDSNVSRFRDFLLPLLDKATKLEEVRAINWDYKVPEIPASTVEEGVAVDEELAEKEAAAGEVK